MKKTLENHIQEINMDGQKESVPTQLNAVEKYIKNREESPEYKSNFLFFGIGFSKKTKINAAKKLIRNSNGSHDEYTFSEKMALKSGELKAVASCLLIKK